jgi:H+-transporting ATPase
MSKIEIIENNLESKSSHIEKKQDDLQVDQEISINASQQVEKELPDRNSKNGLGSEEAIKLLEQYGYNELPEEKANPYVKFLTYFWGPIPWMIEIAALLSALVRHWSDLLIILSLLIVNAIVGFWEEYQAGNAIAALKKKLALKARVKRDGRWQVLPARELVPGDIIRLRIGDIVPADANLMECDPMEVDQSTLTGESLPVNRKSEDLLYAGSIIKQGEADALVSATGKNTYFGKTAQLAGAEETPSHFQKAVLKIGDYLIVLALVLVALILIVAIFRGDRLITTMQFALVLTVAAIPVAMPTVLSVTMAIGARLLAKKEAIVSRLASVEEMAGIDILCSDKTGTLTQNKLTLGNPFCVEGVDEDQLIIAAALASRSEDQDPIDLAVISGVKKNIDLEEKYHVEHFLPFDPVKKRTEARIEGPEGNFTVTKGAAQVILGLCGNAAQVEDKANQSIDDFARRGYRSLGVARKEANGAWQFLGVLPLYDPPRQDSKETIKTAQEMGIQVKMVTGDQVAIGKEIAGQLGLGNNILDADLFAESKPHESGRVADAIEKADGFAQVFPEHKYHIVDTLQQSGHIVGMTGDGVNDAPALRKADAGIAVSGATDAARSAADIVLLSPGLSVIIDAVKESRKIFKRMDSYAIYRIAETIRVLLFMTASILVFNFYPVTAVMIVLLALLNDAAIISIAFDNVRVSDKPEKWNMPVVLGIATLLGILGVFASFGIFYVGDRMLHLDRATLQSLMYLKLSVAGHLTIFITRTRHHFWSSPAPSRILVLAVFGTQLVATLLAVYGIFMAPIGWSLALLVWGYALSWFIINDFFKVAAYRIFDHELPGLLAARR